MLSYSLPTALLACAVLAASDKNSPVATTAFTQDFCTTYLTTKSVVPSTIISSETTTVHPIIQVTYTPSTTVTPHATTVNSTTTSVIFVTKPVVTDTFTTTLTNSVTVPVTSNSTTAVFVTATATSTAATSTSTISAPHNFVYPIPTEGALKVKRSLFAAGPEREAREASLAIRGKPVTANARCSGIRGKPVPTKYVAKVVCLDVVESIQPVYLTSTAHQTKTVTAKTPTITSTVLVVSTSTSTLPDASTTITVQTTILITSTFNATLTQTSTITTTVTQTPVATYYAVCNAANLLSSGLSGATLQLIADNDPYDLNQIITTDSPYSCCVACFQAKNCLGANYISEFTGQECELVISYTCPADQGAIADQYTALDGLPTVITNGPCGTNQYENS